MTYRVRNIVIAVVLAAMAALLTSFYVTNYKKQVQQGEELEQVWVASEDIPAGTTGAEAAKMLTSKQVATRSVVPGAISDPKEVTLHWLRLAGIIALTMCGLAGAFYAFGERDIANTSPLLRRVQVGLFVVTGLMILAQLGFVQVAWRRHLNPRQVEVIEDVLFAAQRETLGDALTTRPEGSPA